MRNEIEGLAGNGTVDVEAGGLQPATVARTCAITAGVSSRNYAVVVEVLVASVSDWSDINSDVDVLRT